MEPQLPFETVKQHWPHALIFLPIDGSDDEIALCKTEGSILEKVPKQPSSPSHIQILLSDPQNHNWSQQLICVPRKIFLSDHKSITVNSHIYTCKDKLFNILHTQWSKKH